MIGIVEAVGPFVTTHKPGDRVRATLQPAIFFHLRLLTHILAAIQVGVGFLRDACGSCPSCLAGDENLCPGFVGTCCGGGRGGFASRVRVAADFAFKAR